MLPAQTMFEHALGERYAQLPVAVQRFHRLSGRTVLHGWVDTQAPATALARLLARLMGMPHQATSGPIQWACDAQARQESWTRHFPAPAQQAASGTQRPRPMRSSLRLVAGQVEECLGAVRLRLGLSAAHDALTLHPQGLRIGGLPCPGWLMPQLVAREWGDADRLHFQVSVALPLVGTISHYQGHLQLPPVANA